MCFSDVSCVVVTDISGCRKKQGLCCSPQNTDNMDYIQCTTTKTNKHKSVYKHYIFYILSNWIFWPNHNKTVKYMGIKNWKAKPKTVSDWKWNINSFLPRAQGCETESEISVTTASLTFSVVNLAQQPSSLTDVSLSLNALYNCPIRVHYLKRSNCGPMETAHFHSIWIKSSSISLATMMENYLFLWDTALR